MPPHANPVQGFEEDREVYVWKPWYIAELPDPGISVSYSINKDEVNEEMMGIQFPPRVDAQGVAKYALLCSRYFIRTN
jgi:hypothetical protein